MPLTRLDNLLSSKTGKFIYVSPDDFNASDSLDNRGNSPLRPFVSIQRAFLEVARFSYVPGVDNDRFDQFTINLSPGTHYIDNRPGDLDASEIPVFNYDSVTDTWNDPSIFDLSNPNNILYRFNGRDGGATIPRGTSLLGTDLRRTQVRALYVPDPADKDVPRCALFNVTGACYFWQFTIFDGAEIGGPLDGRVYTQPGSTRLSIPLFSHHKMTNFVFADKQDLGSLYTKISKAFSKYQIAIDDVYTEEAGRIRDTWSSEITYSQNDTIVYGGEGYQAIQSSTNKRPDIEDNFWERLSTISREFDFRIQENRIVGPVSDTIQLDEIIVSEPSSGLLDVTVRTKINHGFFPGQYVAIASTGLNRNLEGVFQVLSVSPINPKEFTYRVVTTANAVGLIPGVSYTLDPNANVLAEVDSVESASPYVFNVSIRSVWGICGIWADGRKATGFKSMVIAQYTGVSLQKDDRAFIRYDEFSNTWNQAPLTDAFATVPYHIKGDAYWKDDWRNFHVKASDDSFIQNVSIFAVGFADHFLLESGGDMSITNSNSNFGNTSMHSIGYKGFAFNLDKGGYITDVIPPQKISDTANIIRTNYYPIDVQLSKPLTNFDRLYLTGDKANTFLSRPAASINGYRIGARTYINDEKCEKLYVSTTADQSAGETGAAIKSAVVYPQGFKIWGSSLDTLSPANLGIGDFDQDGVPNTSDDLTFFNLRQDAANLIDSNKTFIQAEAFGYILEKYPYLQTIPYVNPNITNETGRYRDARNLILANRTEIVDYAFNQMKVAYPDFTVPGDQDDKCKRDIGLVVDAIAADLYDGGNSHIIEAAKAYFDNNGQPISDGLVGEEVQSIFAFNRARDWAKKAISNLLSNTSLLSVASITANGTTITVTTNSNHGLQIGQDINVGGATQPEYNVYKVKVLSTGFTPTQFQYVVAVAPSVSPATGAFYVSTITIDPANTVDPAGRYKDGANLIKDNRQEIIDRAIAQLYIDRPDFYFPNDDQTTSTSRFKDSYRLIQQNKQEIIDTAWDIMVNDYPDVESTETKCKRDIGYFIDAVSLDIGLGGGNKYSRKFVLQYFDNGSPISNGLVGEEVESVVAFNAARDLMKLAITNQLTVKDLTLTPDPVTDSNTDPDSCANVQSAIDTLTALITARISAGNLTDLPEETAGTVPAGEAKCKRDAGYIIDSVQHDLFWGGNEFTVAAVREYFGANGSTSTGSLDGEIQESVIVFAAAAEWAKKAITNQLYAKNLSLTSGESEYDDGNGIVPNLQSGNENTCVDVQATIDSLFGIVTTTLTSGTLSSLPAISNGNWDCANVRNTIDTLFLIFTTAILTGDINTLPPSNPGPWSTVSESSKCRRDIGYIVEAVTADLRLGGNENVVNAAEAYYTGTGTFAKTGTLSSDGVITGLTSTVNLNPGMSLSKISGSGDFGNNPTILSIDSENQITITITSGENIPGVISFIANELDYIENERFETLDAYDYVRNIAISAMRNHNTYISGTASGNSSIITVPSTAGLLIGMGVLSVNEIPTNTGDNALTNYNDELEQLVSGRVVPKSSNITNAIPSNAYIKKIGDGQNGLAINQIQLGQKGSKFDDGITVNASASLGTNTPVKFFFQLEFGVWANAIKPSVDLNVIQDYDYTAPYGECSSVTETINTFFTTFNTVINNGLGSVEKVISNINTGTFAQRATLFTLTDTSSGSSPSDPHHLETGTPIRLVPRAREGSNVDKRLVRLPKGFDTNTVYYVIAPGRKTDPYDYSDTTRFDGGPGSLQNLMLATSLENAASGIYIYSSETQGVDPNVVIDVYQYVLDVSYDLNQYITRLSDGETFETDEPHIIDVPNSSWDISDNTKYQSVFFKPIGTSPLPSLSDGGTLSANREYYARYVDRKRFKIFDTLQDAIDGANPIAFVNFTGTFYTLTNNKRSPLRFAPEANIPLGGTWYLGTDPTKPNTILDRIRVDDFATKDKTPDTWFERVEDTRSKQDRIYRLRYVVPRYLRSVRDPLRGFVIKARNDSTRRLPSQKILLKPTSTGANVAEFSISNSTAAVVGKTPGREYLGFRSTEHGPNFESLYDPYNPETQSSIDLTPRFRKRITTDSKITFYAQSAKKKLVAGTEYLELNVFDIGVEEQGFKEKIFTTVKIDAPQGGTGRFVANIANLPNSDTSNTITWEGASKGRGRVHAYFNYEGNYYLILKDLSINSTLKYDINENTVFTQGPVTAKLIGEPNDGRSNIDNYLYVNQGANVYTLTPGDTLQAENGSYTVASVEDIPDFDNTFYIFDIDTIRRKIFGQQDGVYYLSCVRGNISPFPTGAGVGENFRNYRFSQPISKLYPEFYKNDPEWFKVLDEEAIDPPASSSAADNYVHGLVTVNDAKSSITKEAILDFIQDPGSGRYVFTGENVISAQEGGASAGSEARRIPVSGDSQFPTEGKLYVELRRPSIARSGNHTFEYLGFGPGNYSTGLPARQEVVLTDIQDFYAQAKRQDGGIVFYTGLNSNGDLYIGNRKINAITGEETFLESALLVESSDQGDSIGNFVTTFDGPVTFNDIVSFLAPLSKGPNQFTSPVFFDVGTVVPQTGLEAAPAVEIKSNISTNDDFTLRINPKTSRETGNIVLSNNRLKVAVIDFNARGIQNYSIRSAVEQFTPDQSNRFGQTAISFGTRYPLETGDILFKGDQIGLTGSLGWIYANNFVIVPSDRRFTLQGFGSNVIRLNWSTPAGFATPYTNAQIGITSANYQVRLSGIFQNSANVGLASRILGAWNIVTSTYDSGATFVEIQINDTVDTGSYDISQATEPNFNVAISNVVWKEVGIIGAEAIRTKTDDIGDYRVGINTIARAPHSAYAEAFVDSATTEPRANLDVVGTTWISGKTLSTSPNNYFANPTLATRTFVNQNNAFLIGGDSSAPDNAAVFRVSTTNNGRVGINTTDAQLNGSANSSIYNAAFAVIGDVTFSGSLRIQQDLAVNGGDITTTITTTNFNILNQSTYVGSITNTAGVITTTGLNLSNFAASINIGTSRTDEQYVNVANASNNVNVRIGNNTDLGSSSVSKINIGGAFNNNESQSYVSFDSKLTRVGGDIALSYLRGAGSTVRITVPSGATVNAFNDATVLNLANNASTITFGGQGGSTTIRNSLGVDASLISNGNFTMNGGLSSFDFDGIRAQLGTTSLAVTGSNTPPFDKTIDLVTIVNNLPGIPDYFVNQLDTAGSGDWGGVEYQQAITNITGSAPNNLPALTGKQYYLPLENSPTYNEGDYLLIDTAVIGSTQHPEIVRIPTGGLVRTGSYPYYIIVERQPLGTFAPIKTNHPDNPTYRTKIRKINIAFDATWTTNDLNAITGITTIQLAEFGGTLGIGDYIILQRRPPFNAVATTNSNILTNVVSLSYPLEVGQLISSQTETVVIPDGTVITAIDASTITLSNPVTGNGAAVFNIDIGEIIKIQTSLTSTTRKLSINNGATPALTTFEVNTVNGDTVIGNPNIENSGNLSIYGNISLVGGCGNGSTTTDRKLTFRNDLYETVNINTCSGDATFGSPNAEVFVIGGFFNSTKASHTTTDPVFAYYTDPQTRQGTGPLTTIQSNVSAGDLHLGGTTQPTWDIPVNSIVGFSSGDLVLIVNSSLITSPSSVSKGEIIRITGTPYTSGGVGYLPTIYNSLFPAGIYPTGGRGQETTIPNTWISGDIVVKIQKDSRTTTLAESVPATGRIVVELPNTNPDKIRIKLINGGLISDKLDDQYLVRIGSEFFLPDSKSGAVDSFYGVRTPKSYRDPATISTEYPQGKLIDFFGGGELTTHDNLNVVSGNFRMFGSDGKTVILSIANDDGHASDGSLIDPELEESGVLPDGTVGLYLNGPANIHGDFRVRQNSCRENGICEQILQFEVKNSTGETYIGDKLYVRGQVRPVADANTPILHIDNIGSAGSALTGPRDLIVYQDGSIDAFGIKQYFTANGGRRWTYLPFSLTGNGQTQGNPLQANNNYLINSPSSGNMVVYLPANALTGDIIRFVDIGGNLQFNSSLVIRALKVDSVSTGIQGDFTGTRANQGSAAPLATAWDSGEMIVQTRNASFGLLFVGSTDAPGDPNALEIPSNLRGWWLVEL
jgi:hypothetical protein